MAIKFSQGTEPRPDITKEDVTKVTKVLDPVTKVTKVSRTGRPPKGERAMTGAERIRAYRERRKQE